jgi:hypothetical protein
MWARWWHILADPVIRFPTFTSLFAYSQVSLEWPGRRIPELINRENNLDQNTQIPGADAGRSSSGCDFRLRRRRADLARNFFQSAAGQTVAIVGQTEPARPHW